ncbi:DNA mismatch repair protein MutT [Mycobacterium sp. CBMA 234]|uniref:(deoxy)nucleoside triphosphate pyrophosphohydrolase n=1 Tax=Mycolicibacterium sp. CBMA 234 TaxID=1918495 RepID=UPI001390E939|nr:(deoxy)nucleoside triphosphate pyrophosphohydrolase [Mycolicibacterium sp. CBMA 234]MUL66783.1 DNA mismatch repair protein MutT [Mycolicibacterium sp. CBMA 234]
MFDVIVVAGALIADARLLVAQRNRPPELAGLWELPGGKVNPGETDEQALARELHEELGVTVAVGARLGEDVPLSDTVTLRGYRVSTNDAPHAHDHHAVRWVGVEDLDDLPWVPADTAWLDELKAALRTQ